MEISKSSGYFTTLSAAAATFSAISIGGSAVAMDGHSHAIADVTGLSSILSGITESSIEKDIVEADVGNFRLLSVSGQLSFSVNRISVDYLEVNGSQVSVEGHTHSASDLSDLSTVLSAYALSSHNHDLEYASIQHSHGISDIYGL